MSGRLRLMLLVLLVLGAVAGCSTSANVGTVLTPTWDDRLTSGFALDVLDDSYVDGSSAGGYKLEVKDYGKDVVVSVKVSDAKNLKALYFNMGYDAERFRPLTAEPTTAMSAPDNLINLTSMRSRGTVTYGQVIKNYQWRPGFTGGGTIAQVMFRKEATPAAVRSVSANAFFVPIDNDSVSQLQFDGTNLLTWDYANRGDYNQDSQVTVSDLTPIGANFNVGNGTQFDRTDAKSVIDGNHDGLIAIQDLTPLGSNLLSTVTGYDVYCTADNTLLPTTDNSAESPASAFVGSALFGDATNKANSNTQRLTWSFTLTAPVANGYYWVRPYQGTSANEGTPSNVILPPGVAPTISINLPLPTHGGAGTVSDEYKVNEGETFTFTLTDPTDGDVTASSTFSGTGDSHFSIAGNQLTIETGFAGQLVISGTYNGKNSANKIYFKPNTTAGGALFIFPDTTDPDWTGVPNFNDPNVGDTLDNGYLLHDNGPPVFNPDANVDGVYDLEFSLVANDADDTDPIPDHIGNGNPIANDTLTWDSFPPFVALDIDDATKGTFHANQFSNGYVFAQDASLNESNHMYVQVKLDQS